MLLIMKNKMNITSKIYLLAIALLFLNFDSLVTEKYQVEIIQNGLVVPIVNDVAQLEKKEFQIRITLNDHDGVFMSASFNRDYFDLKAEDEIKDYKWLNSKSRAESTFNKDKELHIHNEYVSYLFYDRSIDWHRFDKKVIVLDNKVIGTKTVRKIRVEESKLKFPINKIDQSIYLFFVATENWNGDKVPSELGRKKIELRWK